MLNRTSMLLAASIVALSAGAACADDGNYNRHAGQDGATMTGDANQPVYGNGYNYGYDDGYARRERNDRYRNDAWHAQNGDRGYQRGAYYYGSDCSDNAAGTIVGAVAGGVIGNQLGHGNGGATMAGVIVGGIAGNSISRDMNCNDRHYALTSYSAGFEGRIGHRYDWRNGDNRGSFTPVREYSRDGRTCRDFRETSYSSGNRFNRDGTACRRDDGNWYME